MPGIIVIGSTNVDFTVMVDRLPQPGETVLGHEFYQSLGGKGANQAVAAKKAGADVLFLTKLGADANGKLAHRRLLAQGLPPAGLLTDLKAPTGVAVIMVDARGNNQIAVAPGSNAAFSIKDEIRPASRLMAGKSLLLVQLELPLPVVIEALRLAKANRLTTILNPAPPVPLTSEELRLVDILTPNAREAQAMAGQQDLEEATRVLLAKGARCVIVTMGENGALLAHGRKMSQVPPFEVQVVDTTAAGDAFNGALACAVVEGEPLEKAVVFANAAGALATTKRGAQESLPTRREIEGLIHEQRRFS